MQCKVGSRQLERIIRQMFTITSTPYQYQSRYFSINNGSGTGGSVAILSPLLQIEFNLM